MLFNSYIFLLLFLPLSIFLYFFLNKHGWYKAGLVQLLTMSLWFYAYNHIQYLLILVFSIVFNWFVSRLLVKKEFRYKKLVLAIGIGSNIGCIFYFKYFNFFIENINHLFKTTILFEEILLPLGISFYTFQQVSFLVDSLREETAEYTFLEYAVFVSFFPQLVAGPIVMHDEIIPQLKDENKRKFDHENFAKGIYFLGVGLFKKVIIADTFGNAVSWGFSNQEILSSLEIFLIMLFYTFQIYFDFSAYSDMAIGIGSMFNITLPINFNSPYKAYSIVEFWDRWHITLTRFLRKYIYFPLGGSKKGRIVTYINIFLVFLISGIWHGANWTFIIWGIIHGIANTLNRIFRNSWNRCNQVFQWICTFGFINITWLIFRADNLSQAVLLIKRMMCLDSFAINRELLDCFFSTESSLIGDFLIPLKIMESKVNGFYMWVFLTGSIFCVLNLKNIHEKQFKPSITKGIIIIGVYLWTIISFSGVTTFLYFNF